ncbi:GntR family transcriptional regulator [Paraburkholderia sp. SARCC-3016]|uniref:GntR family transcriptional regulator n=1 Tax=Paraburkholderia sp. SARCC-3016 TaxID=3058611 RepID=UPI002807B21F|nr:GntR family transcriptional regulator [Paraburkholderia sp. SARCC-3016]MDQ7982218.1 GntR family transcriptional regulator [Paraburkholderia sp. SARCC-3016]
MEESAVASPVQLIDCSNEAKLLSERACSAIRHDILSCVIEPAATLTEASLMARYGIGKATCRVALQRLAQEGFLRAVPRQGYVVRPITLKDVEEVFALRLQLEPLSARLAAGKADIGLLRDLERACRNDDVSLGISNRIGIFMDANAAFHMAVAEASGNSRLVKTLGGLLNEMARLVALGFGVQKTKPEIRHDHTKMIDALESGNGRRAEQIAYRHVATFRDMTMEKVMASLRDTHAGSPIVPLRGTR